MAPAPGLVRRPRPVAAPPVWDDDALRVLAHGSGVLRVLGGPGSGKTTLLLAAAAARVRAGADPGRTLLLVGSRRAAVDLRERLTAQLQDDNHDGERTLREPLVRTLHSSAFGILRLHAARQGDPPPRLL
ncbi:MAG: UvrD-helicase domain-containing protein, partial [Pseudonocardia sp.]